MTSKLAPTNDTPKAAYGLLEAATQNEDVRAFLARGLPTVLVACHADAVALAAPSSGTLAGGNWLALGHAGAAQPLPGELLSEALDREAVLARGDWLAAPVDARAARPDVLAVHFRDTPARDAQPAVESLLPALRQALATVRERHRQAQRVERLEAILAIAGRWNQSREVESLLVEMAEAAARLLHADRASIFLWDRAAHQLVGRPALGVEGGELRIPDNAGVVGRVIETGQPRRLSRADNPREVNRAIDETLGYRTTTLLCVPLRSRKGELFGAFETLNKLDGDFTDEDEAALVELAGQAAIALENTQEREQLIESRRQLTDEAAQRVQLVGTSPAIDALRSTIGRVAGTELAVLVLGENGTGKEVVSQSIHYQSPRRHHPFIAVNCAALSETLLESELFGHEKGAFTDAHERRPGKFELAAGGTLFLDEIGDLSPSGQAKLLRVLEEKVVVRVGGSKSIHTDARVIAATNQNLAQLVRERRFREDLYFRLNVVTLVLPPLRERAEDVLPLAEFFLKDFCRKARRKTLKLSAAARKRLEAHAWPGNVRELRNLMERLAFLLPAERDKIEEEDLAFILSPGVTRAAAAIPSELSLSEATDRFQAEHVAEAIRRARGNMSEAAGHLGLHRSNLYRKMRQLGMAVEG
ncbi:MAG: sigma-54-dependent Fis family transcriptional regulator [Planctomycetia bacterium]|nr:sigma-54-dependent Fis family transcriptional regulator [Planctomycetia bacterium]